MIEFLRGKAYPEWDPSNPSLVPEIPSWTVSFGEIQISFKEGEKKCVVTKKPCGDYVIIFTYKKYQWSNREIKDQDIWHWLCKIFLINNKKHDF